MTEEEIIDALPSITVARLFYTYGRLDDLLNAGFETANDGFYEMFWELLDTIPDFISYDYNEYSGVTKWYFGFKDMMEYYRLCHTFSRLRGVKLKDSPYMRDAQRFVEHAMDLGGYVRVRMDPAYPDQPPVGQRHRVPHRRGFQRGVWPAGGSAVHRGLVQMPS